MIWRLEADMDWISSNKRVLFVGRCAAVLLIDNTNTVVRCSLLCLASIPHLPILSSSTSELRIWQNYSATLKVSGEKAQRSDGVTQLDAESGSGDYG